MLMFQVWAWLFPPLPGDPVQKNLRLRPQVHRAGRETERNNLSPLRACSARSGPQAGFAKHQQNVLYRVSGYIVVYITPSFNRGIS